MPHYFFSKILKYCKICKKGVYSKPSGDYTKFLFIELETLNFGYLFIFYFAKLCKVSPILNKLDVTQFLRVPLLDFCGFLDANKSRGGGAL